MWVTEREREGDGRNSDRERGRGRWKHSSTARSSSRSFAYSCTRLRLVCSMAAPPSSPSLPRFVTSDGVTIRGSFAPSSNPSCGNSNTSTHKRTRHSPAVILVHGFSMCRGKYEVTMLAHFLWNKGFSVLTLDMRNHGKSDTVKQQGSGKKGVATYVVVGEGHRERGV